MNEDAEEIFIASNDVDSHPETADDFLGSINSVSTEYKTKEEEKLRQKLRFFYMNPIEKWQYKQRFPYKFLVQLIKIIVVTLQSCLFAHHRSFYVSFVTDNRVTFSHLFLQGWDSSREIISYPPQAGDLAIYKTSEFYSAIDFAVVNYANLDEAVGSYSYTNENNTMEPMVMCLHLYETCDIFGHNESYVFNSSITETCLDILITKEGAKNFSSEAFFRDKKVNLEFSTLVKGYLYFGVKTVNLKPSGPRAEPDCYFFNLSLIFDNQAHDGKLKLSLDSVAYRLKCNGTISYQSDTDSEAVLHSLLNSIVIIFCLISFILCSRAIFRAQVLKVKTVSFFRKYHNKELTFSEKLDFVNLWYVTMITSDFVIIVGSIVKERIETNEFSGDDWNICSVMLGAGTFLIWVCVLRYLGFFEAYNVVVLTLKVAAPMILRFMVCTMLIYAGFTFCGWLVLGPYHGKFRTLSITSECLFALLNGDDVFDTFSTLEPTQSLLMWWFCRIYLYFFVSLFIYVIISLFISVIIDAYETIKRYYVEGFPKNFIQEFIDGDLHPGLFSDSSSSLANDLPQCCPQSGPYSFGSFVKLICCCGVVRGRKHRPVIDS